MIKILNTCCGRVTTTTTLRKREHPKYLNDIIVILNPNKSTYEHLLKNKQPTASNNPKYIGQHAMQ